jgi:hypothetical protein
MLDMSSYHMIARHVSLPRDLLAFSLSIVNISLSIYSNTTTDSSQTKNMMSNTLSNDNPSSAPSSQSLRETLAFREFPWLNGIVLGEGTLENQVDKLGSQLEIDQDAYIVIKARINCYFFSVILFTVYIVDRSKSRLIQSGQRHPRSNGTQNDEGFQQL